MAKKAYGQISRLRGRPSLLSQGVRRIVKNKSFAKFTPHDLRRTAATLAQSLRILRDHVKAIYAQWHMFKEKREAARVNCSTSLARRYVPCHQRRRPD
jgi:integrase